ncbi:MAG TPA: hypothetical protein VND66_01070 [Acidobacteriaceae bacterium]|nr:hypothetical protein [Acidobacteriaceae bacterium]
MGKIDRSILCSILMFVTALPLSAKTWYVRPDGGTRYSAKAHRGQCDGKTNAPYPGKGVDRHCAFGDVRYLWSNGSSAGSWAIAGGDTVVISNTYPAGETGWRIGPIDAYGHPFNGYSGVNHLGPFTDYNLPIPAGTAGNPTRILGANFANCSTAITPPGATPTQGPDPSKTTKIFGGFTILGVLNLKDTQYVDVQCLDVTDHSSCIAHGSAAPAPTSGFCNHASTPYSDFAASGILTDNKTANVTFQDVNVHGLPSSGFYGAIGGAITMTRVVSDFNGFAGWNFDDHTPNNPASSIAANYVTMDWNGCNEEYPVTDPWPGTYCYTIGKYGGFGDAWSGQDAEISNVVCNHCQMDYNIKDAFFGPHTFLANATIENSTAMGNGGQTWKANLGLAGNLLFQNNLTKNNCFRLSASFSIMTMAQQAEFNRYLEKDTLCRPGADGAAFSVIMPTTGNFKIIGNTFILASPKVGLDLGCQSTITSLTVTAGGTGYAVNDVLSLGGTSGTAMVTSIGAGGAIAGLSLVNGGQFYQGAGYKETYIWDESGPGTGAHITFATASPLTCTGGTRVLEDNLFLGYADYTAQHYFGGGGGGTKIVTFCYSNCQGNRGTFVDADWTRRSHNLYYDFKSSGAGYCTYSNETCTTNPLLTSQPAGPVFKSESVLDNFTFRPSYSSPAVRHGQAVKGLTTDFFGNPRPNPPSIGAVEP